MPYYARGLDGRIDDPNAGWKGRGLWMTYSSYLPRFTENAQRHRESHADPPQSVGELARKGRRLVHVTSTRRLPSRHLFE